MSQLVITVTPEDSLKTALERAEWAGRHIPVVQDSKVVGIITDRDIRLAMNSPLVLRERVQDERLLNDVPVAACMTPDPVTIEQNAPVTSAITLMLDGKFSGLPVISEETGELMGILTTTDLLKAFHKTLKEIEPLPEPERKS
jgi:acetoin utilization protein AcuB